MDGLAPSPAEVTVVTVLTGAGVLAVLGLLGTLAVLHRRRRPAPSAAPAGAPSRPTRGLAFVTVVASVLLYFGGRLPFVDTHPGGGSATLVELHGMRAPVYWMAYLIGGGLLVVLVGTLLKSPATLGRVVGPPAALTAVLMLLLLVGLKARIDRLDTRLAERHLPGVAPTAEASDGSVGAYPQAGWVMGVLGVALLTLVLVLLFTRPHDLEVLVALTAGFTMLTAPTLIDDDFWALRGGTVQRVRYSVFDLGGPALVWPAVIVGLAALVAAIPFLPKWLRGVATFAAAAAVGWIALAVVAATHLLDTGMTRLLEADGYTVAVRRGGAAAFLYLVTPAILLPIVAVRAWSVSRRRAARP
ncbi:hypothetical protein Daura_14520 [Dactylosporangium aurantiacum]|uniref:Uncharacterized protein n=1 Tax=Dactylosporangium aurantiacum TaxID=35754 RepID=A0A9Q9ILV3_9ACTN|nr:hypothetical protein [Dactylosporangium aurantiacum]MDG6109978.1 hypothetical protein [Dactylosporangium aurantiacum]UWZ57273.1 hypothetical protein Daura_14520 [Dactylosporangium aurantiacum]